MAKVCDNCACYEVCIYANPGRKKDCSLWKSDMKWIPVSERLPEVGDRCLCNVKSFAFPGSFYQAILRYDKYGFVEGCIYTDDVTHWMPLPEPPKEEK